MEFLKSNLWEIKKSKVLQIFGAFLGVAHALTYWLWQSSSSNPLTYYNNPQPMCWSLIENCQWVKFLSPSLMGIVFHGYGVLAVMTAVVFLITRLVGFGWFLLVLTSIFKAILYIQDMRLSGNVHYFIVVASFCYLLVPNKAHLLRWLTASYFAASGLLKLSPNWLSGQWFVDLLHVPVKLGEWLAAVSALVEMLAPMALFFRDLRNFLIAYITLFVYLGLMWYAGHSFFEPMVLMLAIQIFPMLFYEERKTEREYLYQSFIRPEPSPAWLVIGLLFFWGAQALPFIPHDQVSTLKGVESTLAMSPIAATGECEQTTFAIYADRSEEIEIQTPPERPSHFKCNPYLKFLDLKVICREKASDPQFKTLMTFFHVRDLRDQSYRTAFKSTDLCNSEVTYRSLLGGEYGI